MTKLAFRELFDQALALDLPSREPFLAALALEDKQLKLLRKMLHASTQPQLRSNLTVLIGSNPTAANTGGYQTPLLNRSWSNVAERLLVDESKPAWEGRTIGEFRLIQMLGSGGSSWVFRAVRESEGIVQPIALKLFKQVVLSSDDRRRFDRERAVLAQLDHPGIARYIDGGVTDDGLAYIAIELIDGEAITGAAKQLRWQLKERLQAVIKICHAIDAAHRMLIVHRDLKPDNVYVTNHNEIKILDFGIATYVSDAPYAVSTQHVAFTPAYAAPEQIQGRRISTQTDVFALGLLLSELITGVQQDPKQPKAPSGLADSSCSWRRHLKGDLDTIVLKATALDPKQRYSGADQLAEDISRYLANEPIIARRANLSYVCWKFLRRHALASTAAMGALALVLASSIVASQQAKRAQQQAQRAESIQQFMSEMFRRAEPRDAQSAKTTVVEVVETALQSLPSARHLNLEVKQALMLELAATLRGQGALERAKDALLKLLEQTPSGTLQHAQASLELAETYLASHEGKLAFPLIEKVLQTQDLPADTHARALLVKAASVFESLPFAEQAKAVCAHQQCSEQVHLQVLRMSAKSLSLLQPEEALVIFNEALAFATSTFGTQHLDTAELMSEHANVLQRMGRNIEAEVMLKEVVAIYQVILPPKHWKFAQAYQFLGVAQLQLNKLDEAYEHQKRGLAILNENQAPDVGAYRLLSNLTTTAIALGEFTDALRYQERANGIFEREVEHSPHHGAQYGYTLAVNGRLLEGLRYCEKTAAAYEAEPTPYSSRIALASLAAHIYLARVLTWLGRYSDALVAQERVSAIYQQMPGGQTAERQANFDAALLLARYRAKQLSEAALQLQTALSKLGNSGDAPLLRMELLMSLAELKLQIGGARPGQQLANEVNELLDQVQSASAIRAMLPFHQQQYQSLRDRLAQLRRT